MLAYILQSINVYITLTFISLVLIHGICMTLEKFFSNLHIGDKDRASPNRVVKFKCANACNTLPSTE